MAYIIGKKIVRDTEEYDNYAYGITLPVRRGNTGYFEQAFTSYEQAKSNLKNLLLTKKGERLMQPEFGTGLHSVLFEPMTDDFEEKIQQVLTDSVNFWLPYITIEEINVEMTDEMKDNNIAGLMLKFSVGTEISTQEVTLIIRG